jgi:hypothetical protein
MIEISSEMEFLPSFMKIYKKKKKTTHRKYGINNIYRNERTKGCIHLQVLFVDLLEEEIDPTKGSKVYHVLLSIINEH